MRTTPATREFVDQQITDETVYGILDDARFAPSGGNRQGWRVIVVKDTYIRERLRDLYVLSWREYVAHVATGLVPFAPLDNGRWTGPAIDLEAARATPVPMDFADHLDRVPVLLVIIVELATLAVTDNGLNRQSIVGGASVYPFAHNILLAARDAGLGGIMTTMLCRQELQVRELLGIPEGHAVAGLIALGKPTKELTRLRRQSVESFTVVDRFEGSPFRF
jgi:nitroreductase